MKIDRDFHMSKLDITPKIQMKQFTALEKRKNPINGDGFVCIKKKVSLKTWMIW
jgi:hypothetical protein